MIIFIKKWFFPPTFSIMFYPCWIGMWFLMFDDWERTWSNFYNFTIMMLAMFSIFYLAMDTNDGRFTKFIQYVESSSKLKKRSITFLIFLAWFIGVALVAKYFPLDI